jgi:hypothetical protein
MAQAKIMHTSYLGGKRAPSRISLVGTTDAAMLKAWPHVPVLTKSARSVEIVARVADLVY